MGMSDDEEDRLLIDDSVDEDSNVKNENLTGHVVCASVTKAMGGDAAPQHALPLSQLDANISNTVNGGAVAPGKEDGELDEDYAENSLRVSRITSPTSFVSTAGTSDSLTRLTSDSNFSTCSTIPSEVRNAARLAGHHVSVPGLQTAGSGHQTAGPNGPLPGATKTSAVHKHLPSKHKGSNDTLVNGTSSKADNGETARKRKEPGQEQVSHRSRSNSHASQSASSSGKHGVPDKKRNKMTMRDRGSCVESRAVQAQCEESLWDLEPGSSFLIQMTVVCKLDYAGNNSVYVSAKWKDQELSGVLTDGQAPVIGPFIKKRSMATVMGNGSGMEGDRDRAASASASSTPSKKRIGRGGNGLGTVSTDSRRKVSVTAPSKTNIDEEEEELDVGSMPLGVNSSRKVTVNCAKIVLDEIPSNKLAYDYVSHPRYLSYVLKRWQIEVRYVVNSIVNGLEKRIQKKCSKNIRKWTHVCPTDGCEHRYVRSEELEYHRQTAHPRIIRWTESTWCQTEASCSRLVDASTDCEGLNTEPEDSKDWKRIRKSPDAVSDVSDDSAPQLQKFQEEPMPGVSDGSTTTTTGAMTTVCSALVQKPPAMILPLNPPTMSGVKTPQPQQTPAAATISTPAGVRPMSATAASATPTPRGMGMSPCSVSAPNPMMFPASAFTGISMPFMGIPHGSLVSAALGQTPTSRVPPSDHKIHQLKAADGSDSVASSSSPKTSVAIPGSSVAQVPSTELPNTAANHATSAGVSHKMPSTSFHPGMNHPSAMITASPNLLSPAQQQAMMQQAHMQQLYQMQMMRGMQQQAGNPTPDMSQMAQMMAQGISPAAFTQMFHK